MGINICHVILISYSYVQYGNCLYFLYLFSYTYYTQYVALVFENSIMFNGIIMEKTEYKNINKHPKESIEQLKDGIEA